MSLDDIRARHFEVESRYEPDFEANAECYCGDPWPCDTARETARADKAEAALAEMRARLFDDDGLLAQAARERDAARALADELAEALSREVAASGCKPDCPSRAALVKWEASRGYDEERRARIDDELSALAKWEASKNPLPSFGQQIAAKGGRLTEKQKDALRQGGGLHEEASK